MAAAATTSSHLLLLSRQQAASLRCRLSLLGQPRRPGRAAAGQAQAPGAGVRCMAAVDTAPAATETSSTKSSYELVTLTTWLLKQEQAGVIDNEMTIVLASISTACKQIAALVLRAPISNLTGVQGAVNVQGEDQKKLDVISNEVSDSTGKLNIPTRSSSTAINQEHDARAQVFSNCLKSSGRTGVIASEEEDVPVAVEQSYSGNYIVVFDPLDGSSNIDAAVSTGSIFGIYAPNDECLADVEDNGTVRASLGSPRPGSCAVLSRRSV
jgi:fructose-1,6-bisphosphatase I